MTASCVDCKLESSRCDPAFNFSSYEYFLQKKQCSYNLHDVLTVVLLKVNVRCM